MIRSFLRSQTRRFEQHYGYDAGYIHEIIETDARAGLRLAAFQMLNRYQPPAAAQRVMAGALLASTLDGDCGPCAQLAVDMALEAGLDPADVRACLAGRPEAAGDMGLGFRFATAVLMQGPEIDALRDEVARRFGPKAVVACAFGAAAGRCFPVLKRAMGHARTCSAVQVDGQSIIVTHAAGAA